MAKKKKGSSVPNDAPYNGGSKHWSINGDEAENGFIVHASTEGKDGYKSKKFIAPNERAGLRLALAHIGGGAGRARKKGKGKKSAKMAVSKRS